MPTRAPRWVPLAAVTAAAAAGGVLCAMLCGGRPPTQAPVRVSPVAPAGELPLTTPPPPAPALHPQQTTWERPSA